MIDKVHLINFQSHKDSILNFHKGMNVIVGETDSGKSGLIRGLKLAVYNEPNGDEYRSNWGGDTSIEIETNGKFIKRTKTNSKNLYELSDFDTPFTAFGQTVPEEIKEALNMDEINLQQQLDSHFLISETSGKVALHFNKIAKLDKIDSAQGKVQKEINTINSESKHRQKEIEIKQDKLKELPNLDKLEKELIKIETLEITKQEKENQIQELTKLGNQISGVSSEIYLAQKEIESENDIDTILKLYKKRETKTEQISELSILGVKINKIEIKLKTYQNQIKAETNIDKLLKLYENKQKADASVTQLEKLYNTTNKIKKQLKSQEIELKELEKTYKKEFPKTCPLCNTKL